MIPINEMPDNSKVWIYQSDKKFADEEVNKIEKLLADFISNWTSHGTLLKATAAVLYHRFVIIMADESSVKASGCSIDKSVAFIKHLEKEFNCDFFNRLLIAFKTDTDTFTIPLSLIYEKLAQKEITEDTLIFNNLVSTKSELLNKWIIPLKESWIMPQIA